MTPQNGEPPAGEEATDKGNPDSASVIARELHWLEKLNIAGQMSLVIVGIVAASIYGCQLSVMRGTLAEMKRSGEQSTEQVWSAIGNINWMARTMDQSSKDTLAQIKEQSAIQEKSARAAEKAAGIANEALHVSERAYVFIKSPQLDTTTSTLFLPIENLGHLPATNVHVTVHVEKTSKLDNGASNTVFLWFQRDFPEIWPSEPLSVGGVSNVDINRTKKGEDIFTFGATIEYNDGFPDSKRQKREEAYCMSHLENDHIGYGPCMVTNTLDMLRRADQYPNPKYQTP